MRKQGWPLAPTAPAVRLATICGGRGVLIRLALRRVSVSARGDCYALDCLLMALPASEEEEWVGEEEEWPEEEEEDDEDELLGPRALPVDGEPDFESVRARSALRSEARARLDASCVRKPCRFGLTAHGRTPRRVRQLTGWSICAVCAGRRRSAPASLAPRSTRARLTGARKLLAQPQHAVSCAASGRNRR